MPTKISSELSVMPMRNLQFHMSCSQACCMRCIYASSSLITLHTSQYTPLCSTHLFTVHTSSQYTPPHSTHIFKVHTSTQYTPPHIAHLLIVHTPRHTHLHTVHTLTIHTSSQCTPPHSTLHISVQSTLSFSLQDGGLEATAACVYNCTIFSGQCV